VASGRLRVRSRSRRVTRAVVTLVAALLCSGPGRTQPVAALNAPASAPRAHRAQPGPGVVDCVGHAAWVPPAGWAAIQLAHQQVLALSPSHRAALIRGIQRSTVDETAALAALRALLGVDVVMPAAVPVDAAHPARGRIATAQVTLPGGEHAEVRWYLAGGRVGVSGGFWIAVVLSRETRAWSAIDAARASWSMLPSHACQCGDDCDQRARR